MNRPTLPIEEASEGAPRILNLIGGQSRPAATGQWLPVYEPATGQVYTQVADSQDADVHEAVMAAEGAFVAWSAMPATERARHLDRLAGILEENSEAFAHAESRDTGKPLSLARQVDIPRAIANLRFFAHAATQFSSESHAMEGRGFNYTLRQPLGPVACISPWNLPLYLLTWKIAPALAAGNTVVAKPSEVTPYTAWLLGRLTLEAGWPAGVLNIIHGSGNACGQPLVRHPHVQAVSFTGSTRTGAAIARGVADQFKKLSLELGGKNPFIVFQDADFDQAVDCAVRAAFSNQGQICLCGSRFLIERGCYAAFRDALVARARALRPGDPVLPETQFGALSSRAHFEKVLDHITLAQQEGGTLLCGGRAAQVPGRCTTGWFMEPTLIEGLPERCRTNQEEIFGPVASITPFDDFEHAVQLANATAYGLSASVWTQNLTTAHRLAARIDAGMVWINTWMMRDLRTPFGGTKQSGLGREGGWEAMRFFTQPKNVCVAL